MGDAESPTTRSTCRLLLIRHGETVDNVKGLYAGARDSALTNQGFLQANRLGSHLAKQGVKLSHLFSSDLSRAVKTAENIRDAQATPNAFKFERLQCLREQDFGYYEGKPFYLRTSPGKSAKEEHRQLHKADPRFNDIESKDSMRSRAESFVREHLFPVMDAHCDKESTIAVVSHGMLLSTLWKVLLHHQPSDSVRQQLGTVSTSDREELAHLGGWSNTGYLDLTYTYIAGQNVASAECLRASWQVAIKGVNVKDHLSGLKRTRGGVGSSAYDEGQRSIDSFFKKPKTS